MARTNEAGKMALGGVMAALAVVFMCMGGLIPVATYVCPAMCMLLLQYILRQCGRRVGWAWYGAVAILCLLLGPDKEAALVFAGMGYYPLIKPLLDGTRLRLVWKLLFFNGVTLALYWGMLHLLGMARLASEFRELGAAMTLVTLAMGNAVFFLLDRLLGMRLRRKHGK